MKNILEFDNCLILFYTDWCGKCKIIKEYLNDIDNIAITLIDAEKNRDICKKYGVMSVPTLVYFNNGKIDKKQGIMTKEEILKWIGN